MPVTTGVFNYRKNKMKEGSLYGIIFIPLHLLFDGAYSWMKMAND